ncbi:cell division protein ZapE [Thioclava sp. GXIMD4216]|uniref:Cell division protein ZapE n=1 Tax=Thioclava litoralis TaxID=3076557 RepID=A0ABZ1E493_9RHOB|nr:cell division protein ZapE [Thioclava sp. FTW29]
MTQTLSQIYEARVAEGTLRGDDAQRAVLPLLERVRRDLETLPETPPKAGFFGMFGKKAAPPQIKGLYLWGGVGRGKSMLMDLFCEAVTAPKRRVHFHAFMQEVQNDIEKARKAKVEDAIQPVAKRIASELKLLCFDEMQITDIADAMIVGRLFELLFEAGVVVVTTSNRVPEDLYKDGLNRQLFLPFIAILRDKLEVHEIISVNDYRQNRLSGQQVYFTPADREAKTQMDSLWAELTGGHDEKLSLAHKGREITLPHYHNGVARASFWDLCAANLGAGDYLVIAENVRVLFLDGIPSLDSSKFNEAKRFVTMIDALYEAKVRLIASAAAEPEHLYNEGTGSFEFERTASRLREMQAADWGQDHGD